MTPRTVAGGFDTEADEFSDFDRLRTALPASGTAQVSPTPLALGAHGTLPTCSETQHAVLCRDGRFGRQGTVKVVRAALCSSLGCCWACDRGRRPVSLGPFCGRPLSSPAC